MENSEHNEAPVIGRDIRWEAIENQYCRVKHFTPFADVESGKVKDVSKFLPYALLQVECPMKFQGEASMPVLHKLDFQNLWEVFMERKVYGDTRDYGVSTKMEVLVVYSKPDSKLGRLLGASLPRLITYVYRRGSLEKIYAMLLGNIDIDALPHPIAEYDSRPEHPWLR
jgi:hypothetical protein